MSRAGTLLFAILCYAIFFATFLYLVIFVGDFTFATLTVDTGPGGAPLTAALIDIALIALFGIQHSVMARPGFKRAWTRILPKQAERSVYVLVSSVVLMFLFLAWRPIDIIVWDVSSPALSGLLWFGFWVGWLTVLISTFLINHFELFGLQQAWLNLRGREAQPPRFSQPWLYKWVRHPMMLGFFLAFWSTPQMTVGHLILALGMSAYILVALRYEERDLVGVFGKDYERYRDEVGMLTPRFRRRSRNPAA
jgi:protein-S-isoprenylcysteine O-methyltransferase Ste14